MTKDWSPRSCLLLALSFTAIPATLSAQPPSVSVGALIRPIPVKQLTLQEQAQAIPQDKKDRVHFFLINGLDPLMASNVHGVAGYFRSIGFTNTNSFQWPQTPKARRQIENLRRTNPEARIVLMGFSVGANCVRGLANNLQRDGIYVDCLIYVGGDTVFNTASSKPANVGQIVNITGHGLIFLGRDLYFKGDTIDGAANHRLDARHMNIPTSSDTINLVGNAVIALATKSAPAAIETPAIRPASVEQPRRVP